MATATTVIEAVQQTTAAQYLQYEMPDEVLLTIFSYLLEQDLCRLALVCKRFNTIASDTEVWKRLYQNLYEYDLPLFNPKPLQFCFIKPEDSEYTNPWKESFRQLYKGIHVRPGFEGRLNRGRTAIYFNTIKDAMKYSYTPPVTGLSTSSQFGRCPHLLCATNWNNYDSQSSSPGSNVSTSNGNQKDSDVLTESFPLIFVHSGLYLESIEIDKEVALIGASFGNVAESVIIQKETESTISFGESTKAYVGYMTIRFFPEQTSTVLHHKHFCLEIGDNCCPTIENCFIRSGNNGNLFYFLCE